MGEKTYHVKLSRKDIEGICYALRNQAATEAGRWENIAWEELRMGESYQHILSDCMGEGTKIIGKLLGIHDRILNDYFVQWGEDMTTELEGANVVRGIWKNAYDELKTAAEARGQGGGKIVNISDYQSAR